MDDPFSPSRAVSTIAGQVRPKAAAVPPTVLVARPDRDHGSMLI
jgi:hypothetical protein